MRPTLKHQKCGKTVMIFAPENGGFVFLDGSKVKKRDHLSEYRCPFCGDELAVLELSSGGPG